MFGWAKFASTVVVVVDPSVKSQLSAQRLVRAGVGTHLVANKVQDDADIGAIQRAVPLPMLGAVPYDPEVADAEKFGQAPIDGAPNSAAVRAVADLAIRLLRAPR